MANKKEMMVLGAAAAGAASYYLYGKMKPKEEAGKNNASPALNQSKLPPKDSHVALENREDKTSGMPSSELKPKKEAVQATDPKNLDDKKVKDALDAIQNPEVKREKSRSEQQAEKKPQKEDSA